MLRHDAARIQPADCSAGRDSGRVEHTRRLAEPARRAPNGGARAGGRSRDRRARSHVDDRRGCRDPAALSQVDIQASENSAIRAPPIRALLGVLGAGATQMAGETESLMRALTPRREDGKGSIGGDEVMAPIARLSARIPEALAEKVKIRAVKEKRTVQDLLIDALELYLRTPL